ncbi:MAG TPA: hypothetical protein PLY00_05510 [Verrucomicrobiota bacterium]|jgi:hypothetical protein|nr:hypothetical protein [Verrucomicrobiota bacterium]HOG87538.1 hypothetical protein [Verrucomicrobiota bacterium]HOR70733.1 hypothetical protein [Verrucomicrobiota bacterium]HQI32208.1 hypothetical protein [Verrucomicrobiota bacterium]HQK00001.1 hypothetical protein [Verrucomicrobiota bacterium]
MILGMAIWAAEPGHPSPSLAPGANVDVAPWGERASWENGRDVGVWWEDPRDILRVVVAFAETPPPPYQARLEWWQSQWPERRIPRDQPAGAGESGWGHLGDLYQGQWLEADADIESTGTTWEYTFRPIHQKEFSQLESFKARHRTTMRLRLLFEDTAPKIERIEAFTDSVWKSVEVGIEWGGEGTGERCWDGQLSVFNGYVEALAPLVSGPGGSRVEITGPAQWRSSVRDLPDGVRCRVWFADSPNVNTFDSTVVTLRTASGDFSFDPAAVAKGATILSPMHDAVVGPADQIALEHLRQTRSQGVGCSAFRAAAERARTNGTPTLYARVFDEPEQSLERALAEQPPKRGRMYLPVGLEGGRQRFGINPSGSVFCVNDRIDAPPGKDTVRRRWGSQRLDYDFGLPRSGLTRRWIEDDCLPIQHAEWECEGIRYSQTAFATRLDPGSLGYPDTQADDTTILMVKIAGRNLAQEYKPARVALSLRADGRRVPLHLEEGLVRAKLADGEVIRALIEGQGQVYPPEVDGTIQYFGNMPPGTDGFIVVKIPFITLNAPDEIERLRNLEFDREFDRTRRFWRSRVAAATRITTPIPELNNFHRAHVSHLLINCGREPGANRLAARVGGFSYGVFGNESCMMITDLDRRGLHGEAERCLDTFLDYQGTVCLPGDYTSQEGVFNGAFGWEQGGYNQHHGWIMWAMAEHYWFTGDKPWLARHADKLVKACHWITSQRARTRNLDGLRRIERGLLPPGSLEDIGDWRCWMSNNGFSWWGLNAVAGALADIHHPEAQALRAEAMAYRRDILDAFREARVRSPLVALRDGTWIPQIPSEVHRRGRTFGWITVTLEGSIYFLRTGLMAPNDPMAVPIMQDFEDNLYLSERYGYSWEKHGAHWFSRGGISMQPNLLCSPHPYLLRDEIKHFLRAYFNAFASCYYPDTQMMCEHPLPDLGDWRGDHYKASDESNSTYWLRLMFIEDDRDDNVLRLGMALPRAWLADGQSPAIERAATHFGPMSLRYESRANAASITAVLDPPRRRTPDRVLLRFRHPEAKPFRRVEVNGQPWTGFDTDKEWVELPKAEHLLTIVAFY